MRIALSNVFISFEAFCLTLIKKDCQNGLGLFCALHSDDPS